MATFSKRVTDPARVAIAASTGLSPRAVATWSPLLRRTPRVIVPVEVEALVVRHESSKWADCAMSSPPRKAPGDPSPPPIARHDLLPAPFRDHEAPRPRGVYLHWAMPDALMRGRHTTTGGAHDASFPALPDRWLVARLSPSTDPSKRLVTGWVLQSNDEAPQRRNLATWKEHGPDGLHPLEPLDARGIGDLAWAAYYDNVENRFALHDDLAGVESGPLAYLVCGWFADPAKDPLLAAPKPRSLTDFDARMRALGWAVSRHKLAEPVKKRSMDLEVMRLMGLALHSDDSDQRWVTDGSWWPDQTLYHGGVVGLGWPGLGWEGDPGGVLAEPGAQEIRETGGPPPAENVRVAFGFTAAEALGALVAEQNEAPKEALILEGFQLGLLPVLDQPDGRARLEVELHASGFGSLSGGEPTRETITLPATPTTPAPDMHQEPPLPGKFPRPPPSPNEAVMVKVPTAAAIAASKVIVKTAEASFKAQSGRLATALGTLALAQNQPPAPLPARDVSVERSRPRFFQPVDPVILVQGAERSFKHGADDRYGQEGTLACRLSHAHVAELSVMSSVLSKTARFSLVGDDVLDGGVDNGSVPLECEDLLRELILLDPGTAVAASHHALRRAGEDPTEARIKALSTQLKVEQTAWWATRDKRVDAGPIVSKSGFRGELPSPMSVSPPLVPWNPLHLDWEVEYLPAVDGVKAWRLDETDFHTSFEGNDAPKLGAPTRYRGRAHLTGGAAATVASAARVALQQAAETGTSVHIEKPGPEAYPSKTSQIVLETLASPGAATGGLSADDQQLLEDVVSALSKMDVLSGSLDPLHVKLRAGKPADGTTPLALEDPPTPFVPFRAGFLRVIRLRIVDGFGQVLDLAGSSAESDVDPEQLLLSESIAVPGRADLLALPPRFTAKTRVLLRFTQAGDDARDAAPDKSPVCGYVMPNHLDGALEFFDAAGDNLGAVRESADQVAWEDAPGRPSIVGHAPARAIANAALAGVATGLVDWGVADAREADRSETALSALLRVIDTTLWSVDPFGHTGDEHLSLLVGHPIAVMRARLVLEVDDPQKPVENARTAVPVRLGALAHWQDGLLGYFVDDDYTTLVCADGAIADFARPLGRQAGYLGRIDEVAAYHQAFGKDLRDDPTKAMPATAIDHPYVDPTGTLWIRPGQEVKLTLLVEPHAVVHVTTGLLPRKEIGMRREWLVPGLARLAPTFRFGPVLVDPQRIRMPIPGELAGHWSWDHRADLTTWADDDVIRATGDALLPPDPPRAAEGWLRLKPPLPGDQEPTS